MRFRRTNHQLESTSPSWDAAIMIILSTDLWIRVDDLSFSISSYSYSRLIYSLRIVFASLEVSACAFSVALSWAWILGWSSDGWWLEVVIEGRMQNECLWIEKPASSPLSGSTLYDISGIAFKITPWRHKVNTWMCSSASFFEVFTSWLAKKSRFD